jgi:hypothetical protein
MTIIVCWICAILGLIAILALVVILFAVALDLLEDTEIGSAIVDRILKK